MGPGSLCLLPNVRAALSLLRRSAGFPAPSLLPSLPTPPHPRQLLVTSLLPFSLSPLFSPKKQEQQQQNFFLVQRLIYFHCETFLEREAQCKKNSVTVSILVSLFLYTPYI